MSAIGWSTSRRIFRETKYANRLGVCLDTQHLYAAGYDIATKEGYARTFEEVDRVVGLQNVRAFHLNDSKKALGSRIDRHERIGEGNLALPTFWRAGERSALRRSACGGGDGAARGRQAVQGGGRALEFAGWKRGAGAAAGDVRAGDPGRRGAVFEEDQPPSVIGAGSGGGGGVVSVAAGGGGGPMTGPASGSMYSGAGRFGRCALGLLHALQPPSTRSETIAKLRITAAYAAR